MLKLLFAIFVLSLSLACSHHDASVQNSDKQKQWPGANEPKSSNTLTGPNTPAGKEDRKDHTENLTKPSPHVAAPQGNPGDVSQGNNKNPKTEGTTSGPNPQKK